MPPREEYEKPHYFERDPDEAIVIQAAIRLHAARDAVNDRQQVHARIEAFVQARIEARRAQGRPALNFLRNWFTRVRAFFSGVRVNNNDGGDEN